MTDALSTEEEDFQYWLSNMDDALEQFFESIPKELSSICDYSVESLDYLERYLIDKYASVEAIKEQSEAIFIDGVSRYLGETYRKNLGGGWSISYKDPKDVNYALPALDLPGWGTKFCPLLYVTAAKDRNIGIFWSTVLKNFTQIKVPE